MQMTLLIVLEFEIHYIIHINFDKQCNFGTTYIWR
jgi:hypothetical protein